MSETNRGSLQRDDVNRATQNSLRSKSERPSNRETLPQTDTGVSQTAAPVAPLRYLGSGREMHQPVAPEFDVQETITTFFREMAERTELQLSRVAMTESIEPLLESRAVGQAI